MTISFPATRLRRLRSHPRLRDLIRETQITVNDLVLPLFIRHGDEGKRPILSMPGHYQLTLDDLASELEEITSLNIPAVILFGIPKYKDTLGSSAYADNGIIQCAISIIKDLAPDLLVISDLCFCEYTDHGHCGIINDRSGKLDIDNDQTLEALVKQAISHANAGADIIAPSGMIDGMITTLRQALDGEGFETIPILSYAAKYASAFYGPFRQAAEGIPQFGDRHTYQMDPANAQEALREVALDIQEGADMIMVKPASMYLDVIQRIKTAYPTIPLAAYSVSGEYAMLKAAAENGWLDEQSTVLELLTSIKRAGASFIINYFAKEVAAWLQD